MRCIQPGIAWRGERGPLEVNGAKGNLVEGGQIGGIDVDIETDCTFGELNFRADRHTDAISIISLCLFLSHTLQQALHIQSVAHLIRVPVLYFTAK